jgi:hypothetical protein
MTQIACPGAVPRDAGRVTVLAADLSRSGVTPD